MNRTIFLLFVGICVFLNGCGMLCTEVEKFQPVNEPLNITSDGAFDGSYVIPLETADYEERIFDGKTEGLNTLSDLFTEALGSDGADTELFAYRLRVAFEEDPYGFISGLSYMEQEEIQRLVQMVIFEYPASERHQIDTIIRGFSDSRLTDAVSAFLFYLE